MLGGVKVLVVEDDAKVARFLARVLTEEGFAADLCGTAADAVEQAQVGHYDLCVLDWMLPDGDGLSVCRDVRRAGLATPILMLTARGEVRDRVRGLDAGADDYLVKPFDVDEFVARVRALLRRARGGAALRCGPLAIDPAARRVRLAGAEIDLTAREYALLLH